MKTTKFMAALLLLITIFSACKKDQVIEANSPKAENIEIGSANNKQALKGRDFHFNADVLAGDKIKAVQLKIVQKSSEQYTANWKLELAWDEYIGAKNTNVHKHFTIPAEAPDGKYDFYFIVLDENGTKLELKEELIISDPANMPVDPKIGRDMISRNETLIYYMDTWVEQELIFKKGDELTAHAQISEIKGDGILYTVLIRKSANYYPESIDKLDFSKAIVISKVEHKNLPAASKITTLKQVNGVYGGEKITIGASLDGNEPAANPITGGKAWESGKYNLVILYKNTSYNMNVFKVIPVTINYQ
ncbi:DUF4625 domain-containing protein [Pedobacter sp. MC2016-24]|uniref:DUF4625 domain-containing protein n=1 Tax=Pedobacter sp. MC2016-24 TaxID=2780090 RepID=UPI00187FE653|nr:DUF4625 domain-containing protein [Pedobacter sp. MC2016-24]MBE9601834.1 DUF4625 domain-containing protein [Pedobacter sp. MC2016-24]